MSFFDYLTLCLVLYEFLYVGCASVKRNNESELNVTFRDNAFEENVAATDHWWESKRNSFGEVNSPLVEVIQQEIIDDLNQLGPKEKYRLFDNLKNQKKTKFFGFVEYDSLSPVNINELKAVHRSMKTGNASVPTLRNKRTLNFLMFAVARAMGYSLIPRNPNLKLMPSQSSPCRGVAPRPPPCAPPPPPPPMTQPPPTFPPNQIDVNTIRYPYRPSQQIPLLQFAPLPPGVTVPYPPLLQWPCEPKTRSSSPNPCAPSVQHPLPSAPPPSAPCTKPPPRKPPCTPPAPLQCFPPPKNTSPQSQPPPSPPSCTQPPKNPSPPPLSPPFHHPSPPCATSRKNLYSMPTPPPPPCTPPSKNSCFPMPSHHSLHLLTPSLPKQAPYHPRPPKPPVTLEYDHPVKIEIFNNAKKFLPASSSVYSGNPSQSAKTHETLEKYEILDEDGEKQNDKEPSSPNIFLNNGKSSDDEGYDDGQEEINEEFFGGSPNNDDEEGYEDENEQMRKERFYGQRMVPQSKRKRKSHPRKTNFIDGNSKEHDHYSGENIKKGVRKRVINIRKPVPRQVDEYGNEYTFARSTVHEIRKRDLQDFDFIRKYKGNHGDTTEDEHYRDENPPGRTTTSIKKIEVKKFFVKKSEDDPVEYHEKHERDHDGKPQKVGHIPNQPQQEEQEEEGGDEDERISYRQYKPSEYEGRPEIEEAIQKELARKEEGEEEEEEEREELPKTVTYDRLPPSGRGLQYVTKTITKYVGGSGGKETIKVVPIYKVVHLPPPLPPRPPAPVKKVIHHHHHRIPVYPKIIVRSGPAVKRRPSIIAGLSHPGNVLLVTIRERNG